MTRRPSNFIYARSNFDQAVEAITEGFRELAGDEALGPQPGQVPDSVGDDFVAAADSLLMAIGSGDV